MWLGARSPSMASTWLLKGKETIVLTFGKMGERVQASITQSPDERSVNTTCLKGRPWAHSSGRH